MTIRWSAVSAISLIRCDETKTVRPSAASSLSRLRIQWMPSGSRPLTGSSRISVCGSPSSAAAMPSRWPMPSENSPARFFATVVQPDEVDHLVDAALGMPCVCASASRWLYAERPGVDGARLEQRADLVQRRGVVAVGLAVDGHVARGRRVEAEDQPHRRRLPGAVRAEEAGHDPGLDGEGELVDGALVAVVLRQAVGLDHPATSGIGLLSTLRPGG